MSHDKNKIVIFLQLIEDPRQFEDSNPSDTSISWKPLDRPTNYTPVARTEVQEREQKFTLLAMRLLYIEQ